MSEYPKSLKDIPCSHYILNADHTYRKAENMEEYLDFFENTSNRIVKQEEIGKFIVSTVFLSIDHNFNFFEPDAKPLLFETMIFGDMDEEYQTRCSTWDEALEMHEKAKEYLANLTK